MVVYAEKTANYWRIRIKSPRLCKPGTFRTQDMGRPGHTMRIACKNKRGKWMTQAWRIYIGDVSLKGGTLVANNSRTAKVLKRIRQQYGAIKVI